MRCHMQAFDAIGGTPIKILYDRMKTAVTGEDDQGHIVYNRSLLALAKHYRFQPRACRPYRAKTKGKVERPFRYIREDFFLGRSFRNLEDLNAQLVDWLDTVANVRVHGTTQRVVAEAFVAEQPELQTLPEHRFDAVLKLERRVSHDGFVAIGGNYYSVPDRTRRVVEVQQLPDLIRILDLGTVVAEHPVLEGRKQYRIDRSHRTGGSAKRKMNTATGITVGRIGDHLLGPPGTGKSHLATALAVEAVRAGKSVYFIPLADLVAILAKAERKGTLRERIRFLCRSSLLVVDEIGYLPVTPGGGNLFFQLVNARYEKGAMILTSNRGFAEWGDVFGDPVVATALLDRLLHHAVVVQIEGSSYRMREHAALVPKHVRARATINPPPAPKRRGRPPLKAVADQSFG